MSKERPNTSEAPAFEDECTEAGQQTLVPGVAPVTLGDRLALLANAPLLPLPRQPQPPRRSRAVR